MNTVAFRSLFALVLCSAAGACSGSPDESDVSDQETSAEDALRASTSITPGSWKMYADANHAVTPGCDVHTSLDITKGSNGATAKLEKRVGGMCEIAVVPDLRSFRLKSQSGQCGIKIHSGSKRVTGGRRSITITDYRTATCALSAASIVLDETFADGSTTTLYSAPNTPVPTPTPAWLTVRPTQCQTNPWDHTVNSSNLSGEAGKVATFFASKQIAIDEVGVLTPRSPAVVCAGCSCPRGDLLAVKAATVSDATRLQTEFGFAPISNHAVSTGARSCNTNPWDPNHQTQGTAQDLNDWIAQQGVTASYAGFAEHTEITFQCQACGCPRGDRAVAIATTTTGENKLLARGWDELE